MEPPGDAIETIGSFVWLEDGIVFTQAKGITSTYETIDQLFRVVRDLMGGRPGPLLHDNQNWAPRPANLWPTVVGEMQATCTAAVMLVSPESESEVGPFPEVIDRMVVPFKVMTDEAEALAFLQRFLPGELPNLEPPNDAAEVTEATVWLNDGIIFQKAKPVRGTAATVEEVISAVRELSDGVRRPLFHDVRNWPGGDAAAWSLAHDEMPAMLTRVAMLVDSQASNRTGPFSADRWPIPFGVFTDQAEALAFLRGNLPHE